MPRLHRRYRWNLKNTDGVWAVAGRKEGDVELNATVCGDVMYISIAQRALSGCKEGEMVLTDIRAGAMLGENRLTVTFQALGVQVDVGTVGVLGE